MTDLSYLVEVGKEHLFPTCAFLSDEMEGVPANTPVLTGLHRTARGVGAASVGTGEILSSISRCTNN